MELWWDDTCGRIIHLTVLFIFSAGLQAAALAVLSGWQAKCPYYWEMRERHGHNKAATTSSAQTSNTDEPTCHMRKKWNHIHKEICLFLFFLKKTTSSAFISYLKEHEYKSDSPFLLNRPWEKNSTLEIFNETEGGGGSGRMSNRSRPELMLGTLRNSCYSIQTVVHIQSLEPSVSSLFLIIQDISELFNVTHVRV